MVCDWQAGRVGLLQQLLLQKMGLFQHTQATDLQHYTKVGVFVCLFVYCCCCFLQLAAKHCNNMHDINNLIRNNAPVNIEVYSNAQTHTQPDNEYLPPPPPPPPLQPPQESSSRSLQRHPQPLLEAFYQENPSHGPTARSVDPTFNHGQQFRESHLHQRKVYDTQELLGKVFQSWQSRSTGSAVPVSATIIAGLKRMARQLHYCSSSLLMQQCLPSPPPLLPATDVATTTTGESPSYNWFDRVKDELLSLYIRYLQTLGFQTITERSSVPKHKPRTPHHRPPPPTPSPPTPSPLPPLKLYKCLQRSWHGGIMLVELLFRGDRFHVKLYTLESSRLVGQTFLSPEVCVYGGRVC